MLSSVLKSTIAIEINRGVVRAFVTLRQFIILNPANNNAELEAKMNEIKTYIGDVFTDYNYINEDTHMQIELINQSLAELHTDKK